MLTTDNGGSGNDFTNTTFDQSAGTSITAGSAPFSGTYRPEGNLSALNGQNAQGEWRLYVYDDAGGDRGYMYDWELHIMGGTTDQHVARWSGSSAVPPSGTSGTGYYYVNVPRGLTISDIDMGLNMTHTWDGDLGMWLLAPDGTQRLLAYRLGGSGNNYQVTIFDDTAGTAITSGSPPFNGRYRPQEAFSSYNNRQGAGQWRLQISDYAGGDSGRLYEWWIHMVD